MQDRGLGRGLVGIGRAPRELVRQRQQQFGQALRDRRPFHLGQGFERTRGRVQHAGEDVAQAAWPDDARLAESQLAGDTAVQRLRCHRQYDRAHVALENHAAVAAARQQQQISDRHDAMLGTLPKRHAVLHRQQRDRQRVAGLRQRRYSLRARRNPAEREARGVSVRRGGMAVIRRHWPKPAEARP